MQNFKAYAGVVPGQHESGTSVYKKPSLAKIANRNLRRALYLCAWVAVRHNKECIELFSRLPPHLKPNQKYMHVASLLAKQIWYCVRNLEVYKPENLRKPKAPKEGKEVVQPQEASNTPPPAGGGGAATATIAAFEAASK